MAVLAALASIGLVAGVGTAGSGAQEAPSGGGGPEVQALPPEDAPGEPSSPPLPADAVVPDQYLVSLDEDVPPAEVPAAARALAEQVGGEVLSELPLSLNGFAIEVDAAGLAELAASDDVASAAPNGLNAGAGSQTLVPCTTPCNPTPRPEELWNLDRVNQRLPRTRDNLYSWEEDGAGVDVYVLDSGMRASQIGFGGRAEIGHDVFPGDPVSPPPANGNTTTPFVNTGGQDCNGHGTHVAGTVGADLYGVARGAHLIGVRVLGCNNQGTDLNIIDGIEWMIDDADGNDPGTAADGPTVGNMSLTGPIDFNNVVPPFNRPETATTEPIAVAVKSAIDARITMVAAAGNNGATADPAACSVTPAALPGAITVAASTQTDAIASFSNVGSCVDIVAPGDQVWSLWNVNPNTGQQTNLFEIQRLNGTSMATPAVTGAAAMILQENPSFTPAQVRTALVTSATAGALTGLSGTTDRLLWVGPNTFGDVGFTNPFFQDIEWMAEEGISNGTPGSPKPTYLPVDAVSRQAMSAFMHRLAGEPPPSDPVDPTFGDVSPSNPFYTEIEWMAAEDITTGTPASPKPLYKPSDPVSRQAMSAFMYRLAGEPPFTAPAPNATTFADVSATHPFYEEIEWMADEGITNGTPGSPKPTYLPARAVSRQAMGAFMHRLSEGPGVGV